jgi:[acyl-carrier-protein] S-malonyltransferase
MNRQRDSIDLASRASSFPIDELRTVAVFPGQGLSAAVTLAGFRDDPSLLETAEAILGYDVKAELGSLANLDSAMVPTSLAQPAIFLASVASWRQLGTRKRARIGYFLGHSLGEYAALVAADCMSLEDGLRIVKARGEAMELATRAFPGGMAAVTGLDISTVADIAEGSGVVIANDNGPRSVVVSGTDRCLGEAARLVRRSGGKFVLIGAAGPFHCLAQADAALSLREALDTALLKLPELPVLSNVTARPYESVDEMKKLLVLQLTNRVRFRECLEWLWEQGVRNVTDVGPGRVAGKIAGNVWRTFENTRTEASDEAEDQYQPYGEMISIRHRVIVSPGKGKYFPEPPQTITTEGEWVERDQVVGTVRLGDELTSVRSPYRGWVMHALAGAGQPVHQGQALLMVFED